jgi:hypothetical protein
MSNEAIKHHMAYKISHWLYVYITVKCLFHSDVDKLCNIGAILGFAWFGFIVLSATFKNISAISSVVVSGQYSKIQTDISFRSDTLITPDII